MKWLCLKEFLKDCIKQGIYTKQLRKKISNNKLEATHEVCNDFLKMELSSVGDTLQRIDSQIVDLLPLLDSLPFCAFVKFTKMVKYAVRNTKQKCIDKYRRLRSACAPVFPADMDERIINLSS